MNEKILELKNINITFGGKKLLENFSLELSKGEKVHLNSPSGTGKSTLLKMIMGFQPIQSGEILLENKKLTEETVGIFRKKIGYLSQKMSFRNIQVNRLFIEIMDYKANEDIKKEFQEKLNRLPEFLEFLELEDKVLEQNIDELSGGEKQRIGFLIAILLDRNIWILDEITSSLDTGLKEKILNYILKTDKTVLLVSHDSSEALDKFRKVVL